MTERRAPWTLSGGFEGSELPPEPEEREGGPRIKCVNLAAELGIESDLAGKEAAQDGMTPAESVVVYKDAFKRKEVPPLFIGMPHSGELVPEDIWKRVANPRAFGPQCGLDAGTRTIFEPSRDEFLAVRARLSRGVVDCNREPTDFTGKAPSYMGVSWERDLQGKPVYREGRELSQEEKEQLISQFYNAYYRRLHAVAATLLREHKELLFVDGHSFPGDEDVPAYNIRADEPKPLIILGTGKGKVNVLGAKEEIVEALRATLEREVPDAYQGWSPLLGEKVAVNKIWTGTRNVRYWGREQWVRQDAIPPASQAIQIEVNQGAYFKDGKYDREKLKLLHEAIYAGLQKVAEMLKKR
mgnify:CR=1 FL=1